MNIEILFKISKFILKYIINRTNWKRCFKEALSGARLNCESNYNGEDYKIFKEVFSDKTSKRLADFSYELNCIGLLDRIKSLLHDTGLDLAKQHNLECDFTIAEDEFIKLLLEEVLKVSPLSYLLLSIDNVNNNINEVEDKIDLIESEIEALKNKPTLKLNFDTLNTIDKNISKLFKFDKEVGIDLFNFEDKEFSKKIKDLIDNEDRDSFRICGAYQRETLYATLYELKRNNIQNVIIVNDRNSWDKIDDQFPSDTVFINGFFNDDLINLSGYKFIEILSNLYEVNCDIKLKNRLYDSSKNAFLSEGFSPMEADDILTKCHNIFPILLEQNFNGTPNIINEWYSNIDDNLILTAMLLQAWNENCDGDKKIIEKLSNESYSQFISKVNTKKLKDNPFVFKGRSFSDDLSYKLTSLDETWMFFYDKLDSKFLNKFLDLAKEVLCTTPNFYKNYSTVEYHYGNPNGEYYSNSLRKGILNSLAQIKKFNTNDDFDLKEITDFVFNYIQKDKLIDNYYYGTSLIDSIAEFDPEGTIKIINDLINNKEWYEILFNIEKPKNYLENGVEYANVLWALEKLLFFNKTKKDSINLLFKLYCMDGSKKDKLLQLLKTALFLRFDSCSINTSEKINVIKDFYKIDLRHSWTLTYELIESLNDNYLNFLCRPNILNYDYIEPDYFIIGKNLQNIIVELCLLLISNANTSQDWVKIIKQSIYFKEPSIDFSYVKERLIYSLPSFNDEGKQEIYESIVNFIYDNRKFADSNWATCESNISLYEELLNEFNFENEEYKYFHLFNHTFFETPVINPIPYSRDDFHNTYEDEEKLVNSELDEVEKIFVKDKLDIFKFFDFAKNKNIDLIKEKTLDIAFKTTTLTPLENSKKIIDIFSNLNTLTEIARYIHDRDESLYFDVIKSYIGSDKIDYILEAMNLQDKNNYDIKALETMPIEIQEYFWKNNRICHYVIKDRDTLDYITDKLIKYCNYDNFIPTICNGHYNLNLTGEECLNYIDKATYEFIKIDSSNIYEFERMLNAIETHYLNTTDQSIIEKIASLELYYPDEHRECKRNFLYESLAKDASIYSYMCLYLYKNNKIEKPDAKITSAMFSKDFAWKFCPGVINGHFDEEVFDKWIDDFKNQLMENGQFDLYYSLLGKLFARSIRDEDGILPVIYIRNFIEGLEDNQFKRLQSSFCCEVFNSRGVHTYSDGSFYFKLSNSEKSISNKLSHNGFKNTAKIYKMLSESDNETGIRERENEEHGRF